MWVTKYHYKVLKGNLALRAQDLIRKISEQHHVRIIGGHVGREHVRLFVSALMQFDSSRWRTSALAGFSRNKRLSVALETYRLSAGGGLVVESIRGRVLRISVLWQA